MEIEAEKCKKELLDIKIVLNSMEKKKEISDNIIKNLQMEKVCIEKKLTTETKIKQELDDKFTVVTKGNREIISKLSEEIEEIQKENKSKMILLEEVENKLTELEKRKKN